MLHTRDDLQHDDDPGCPLRTLEHENAMFRLFRTFRAAGALNYIGCIYLLSYLAPMF